MPGYTLQQFSSAPRVPFKLAGRILFSDGRYELLHLTLLPGDHMDIHTQQVDVVFFVVEGTGTLTVGEETIEAVENTAIHVRSGVPRAWANSGNQPVRILVNKLLIAE